MPVPIPVSVEDFATNILGALLILTAIAVAAFAFVSGWKARRERLSARWVLLVSIVVLALWILNIVLYADSPGAASAGFSLLAAAQRLNDWLLNAAVSLICVFWMGWCVPPPSRRVEQDSEEENSTPYRF